MNVARRNLKGRLELTWMGKDQALIPTSENTYDYTWVDKNDPRACQTHYLQFGEHVGDPSDGGLHDNLLITGDSGDALEALTRVPELAEKYVGRVKCIYIDPPFNTGGTFTNYEDNLEHSIWLTLMRDRLVLLKKLLTDDGSIWVHLDDSENHRMRLLMDEVFGAGNFVAEVVWQKADSPRADASGFSSSHDVILVYGASMGFTPNRVPDVGSVAHFKEVDEHGNRYVSWSLRKWGSNSRREDAPGMHFPIAAPDGTQVYPMRADGSEGVWRWGRDRIESQSHLIDWLDKGNGIHPYVRQYMGEDRVSPPVTWWSNTQVGHNRAAKTEIKSLFPGMHPFATPKPEALLERVIHIASDPGDLVLDCFAGSGTTAAVAHKMGRRWLAIELLPETVETFTCPRLELVVAGADPGGITSSSTYEPADTLPGTTTVEEARTTSTALGRAVKALTEAGVELDAATVKAIRDSFATKKVTKTRWEGGGGFDVATLSPLWVEVVERGGMRLTRLTAEATGEVLERSVAAHLGFHLTPDDLRFVGRKGRQRLAVVEGVVPMGQVVELTSGLEPGDAVTVVCDGAEEGVDAALRQRAKGSRVLVMPDDLFLFEDEAVA